MSVSWWPTLPLNNFLNAPLRYFPNLASINTPHLMTTQYTRQQTSTYYSQRSSTTGYCGYNSHVYPPHQQQFHQTDPTNITWSSSTTYSYSAPMTVLLTTTHTLRPVLPPCSHLFSYPDYSLPPTADTTNPLINALEFTSPHPCVNDYLVYPPTNYDMTMNHIM